MIKTKSHYCKGVNSQKHPQNMHAGYDYHPALQILQCLILILILILKTVPFVIILSDRSRLA